MQKKAAVVGGGDNALTAEKAARLALELERSAYGFDKYFTKKKDEAFLNWKPYISPAEKAGKLERHVGSGQRHALCAGFGQRAAECFDTGGHGSGFETSGISGYKG